MDSGALSTPVSSSDLVSSELWQTRKRRPAPVFPSNSKPRGGFGASGGTRTRDHLITNQELYQLSYAGE